MYLTLALRSPFIFVKNTIVQMRGKTAIKFSTNINSTKRRSPNAVGINLYRSHCTYRGSTNSIRCIQENHKLIYQKQNTITDTHRSIVMNMLKHRCISCQGELTRDPLTKSEVLCNMLYMLLYMLSSIQPTC